MTANEWVRCATLVLILVLHASMLTAQQKSAESLLQEGANHELVAGNLTKAIATYREILEKHPTNRRAGAQALANLGRAYEKLGAAEARAAYQRLLREYADQAEPARFARTRLEALEAGTVVAQGSAARAVYSMVFPDLPALRLVDNAQFDFSPAGDQIVIKLPADGADSTLGSALVVASSGGAVLRTLVPATREVGRDNPRWSPDGKYIAYREASWIGADTSFGSIKVIPAEGGPARTITTRHYGTRGGFFWTPDSRAVTVAKQQEIVTIDLEGQVLRSVPVAVPYLMQVTGYSPDGRWLAFHRVPEGTEQEQMDVWLMPAEGGRAIQLTNTGQWDAWPEWAADGRALYFVSNRSGSSNIWKLNVDPQSGLPRGEPVQLTSYTDVKVRYPRVLQGGTLAFALIRETGTVRIASSSDPAGNRAVARGTDPQLSPDGRTVYFVGQGVSPPGIFAASATGNSVPRRLTSTRPVDMYFRSFSLSPDGRSIAYFHQVGSHNVLQVVQTSSGTGHEVARIASREHLVPAWSADGSMLAYTNGDGLFVIPATGGVGRKIARLHRWDGWTLRWSPDGKTIAALAWKEPSRSANAVFVVPASGGEPRQLTPAEETGYKEMVEWHPDSDRLTYMFYGNTERADGTRVAYMDGRASTLLVDQPYPVWDYVGVWHPAGRDYYFIAASYTSWSLYAHDERSGATRIVWHHQGAHPGAFAPSFSRDGQTMAWQTATTARQLWIIDGVR